MKINLTNLEISCFQTKIKYIWTSCFSYIKRLQTQFFFYKEVVHPNALRKEKKPWWTIEATRTSSKEKQYYLICIQWYDIEFQLNHEVS